MKINTFNVHRKSWFRALFRLNSSILPEVLEKSLFFAFFTFVICVFNHFGLSLGESSLSSLIPTLVLSLLLVFRTNTANERFWEGRKLWGTITNTLRNLTWQIWINVKETNGNDRERKLAILKLLTVFAICTKNHLREEGINEEIKSFLSLNQYQHLQNSQHIPLQVAAYLGEYLYDEYQRQNLDTYQLTAMQKSVTILIDMVGGCERIIKTPIPYSYHIHLHQFLFFYCLLLPFQCIEALKWASIPFVAIVSYVLYGIDSIASEIENPFGLDENDLPLDRICQNINQNIQNFILNQNP